MSTPRSNSSDVLARRAAKFLVIGFGVLCVSLMFMLVAHRSVQAIAMLMNLCGWASLIYGVILGVRAVTSRRKETRDD